MGLYCVKYDQKNGVIADLEKIICHFMERKNKLLTQKKISVPGRGFCDWEKMRSARLDGRDVVSYPKICNLFFRYVLSIELFRKANTNIPHLPM